MLKDTNGKKNSLYVTKLDLKQVKAMVLLCFKPTRIKSHIFRVKASTSFTTKTIPNINKYFKLFCKMAKLT